MGASTILPSMSHLSEAKEMWVESHAPELSATSAFRKPVCASTWISVRTLRPAIVVHDHARPLRRQGVSFGMARIAQMSWWFIGITRSGTTFSWPISRT